MHDDERSCKAPIKKTAHHSVKSLDAPRLRALKEH
jgi:hypothetical protein